MLFEATTPLQVARHLFERSDLEQSIHRVCLSISLSDRLARNPSNRLCKPSLRKLSRESISRGICKDDAVTSKSFQSDGSLCLSLRYIWKTISQRISSNCTTTRTTVYYSNFFYISFLKCKIIAIAARNYCKIGNLRIYFRTSPVIGTGTAAGYVYRTTGTNFTRTSRITSRPWLFTCFSISTATNKWHLNRGEI